MTKRPNILLIVADDMGYGDLGIFSEGRVKTPNLDRLVSEGVTMQQHYTASPICSPARAALLTGRYPQRTGSLGQYYLFGLDRIALRETTIADTFKTSGYCTGLVGKWHNGCFDKRFEPNARGFEEFSGFCAGWSDYYDWKIQTNDTISEGTGKYLTDVLTEYACDYLDRHKQDDFFLMLTYNAPHSPFQAPLKLIEPYLEQGHNRVVATTYAMIEAMDMGIGQILNKLDDLKLAEDTIVIFTSDNGPAFFNPINMMEPGESNFNERFNAGMKGSKGWIYEGGIRVPFIIRHPASLPQDVMNYDLAHFTDWLPTLAKMCDVDMIGDQPIDGHDLSAQLKGLEPENPPRRFWQWNFYFPNIHTNAAVRDGKWKLVRPMIEGTRHHKLPDLFPNDEEMAKVESFFETDRALKKNPSLYAGLLEIPKIYYKTSNVYELYDLSQDPGEQKNVADQNPHVTRKLLVALENWYESIEKDRKSIDDPIHQREIVWAD